MPSENGISINDRTTCIHSVNGMGKDNHEPAYAGAAERDMG